jgi:hypothetical protein
VLLQKLALRCKSSLFVAKARSSFVPHVVRALCFSATCAQSSSSTSRPAEAAAATSRPKEMLRLRCVPCGDASEQDDQSGIRQPVCPRRLRRLTSPRPASSRLTSPRVVSSRPASLGHYVPVCAGAYVTTHVPVPAPAVCLCLCLCLCMCLRQCLRLCLCLCLCPCAGVPVCRYCGTAGVPRTAGLSVSGVARCAGVTDIDHSTRWKSSSRCLS